MSVNGLQLRVVQTTVNKGIVDDSEGTGGKMQLISEIFIYEVYNGNEGENRVPGQCFALTDLLCPAFTKTCQPQ